MENWGYQFDLVSNGLEAVACAKMHGGKYDLCLMDVEMPGMNGIGATKLIRRMNGYFPIIGLTTNSSYRMACYVTDVFSAPRRVR